MATLPPATAPCAADKVSTGRADVPWKAAVRMQAGGTSPRHLRRRMREEERARQAAARRGKLKLQGAVGMLGVMAQLGQDRAEAQRIAEEAERTADQAAEREREQQARRACEEAEARERSATRAAQRAAAVARRAEEVAEAAMRDAEEAKVQAAAAALPWGWELQKSASTGECYYFNKVTGDCSWSPPTEEAWSLEPVPQELSRGRCWVEVLQSATLRSTVLLTSEVVGAAAPGELLFVLEFAHVPFGRGVRRARVRCYGGWLSVTAKDGSVAVQLAAAPPLPGSMTTQIASIRGTLPGDTDVRDSLRGDLIGGDTDAEVGADKQPVAQSEMGGRRVWYIPSLYKRSMCSTRQSQRRHPQRELSAAAR